MAYMCTGKKPLRSHSTLLFFLSSSSALLSLEDHSSEVQVVKHLLHSLSRPFPLQPPRHLQARCAPLHKSTLNTHAREFTEHAWECGGLCQVQKMVQVHLMLFSPWKSHSRRSHWFLCFQRSSYVGRWEESTEMNQGNGMTFSIMRLAT